MKISWNWLREYLPMQLSVEKAAELLTDIGLEVEGVYDFETIKGGLKGLVVGEVKECIKHPDADKLKITKVDIGNGALLNIVCGAPNVAINKKVIVAQVGTKIFPVSGEPFIIKRAKIRGIESEGMLCAEDEIGIGESHEGLYFLIDDAIPGADVREYISVYSDKIIEIGLTANHADANSHIGTAKELYAALTCRNIEKTHLKFPVSSLNIPPDSGNSISVSVLDKQACPRYSAVEIKNITLAESPMWLKNKLLSIGLRPINNVVDITNYILHESGQPLHAFDADKIRGKKIIVKKLPEGTSFISLDGKERKLSSNDLMICDAEDGICIAGVYGGLSSGVSDSTKNIFLESAYFDPLHIRKTESLHQLKTDASSRFGKGVNIQNTVTVLQRAASLILEICGGEIASAITDIYEQKLQDAEVYLRFSRLELIAGMQIPIHKIEEILQLLQITIINKNEKGLALKIPSYKNDVVREIDVIEEILRMNGYEHIPLPSFVKTPYSLSPKPNHEKIKTGCAQYLASQNFYEIFTNSISRSKFTEKYLSSSAANSVKLLNSLNVELDSLRMSLLFSGLEVIQWNLNRKQENLKLFEFGKIFNMQEHVYSESEKLAIFITGSVTEENWNAKTKQADFFDIKKIVESMLNRFQIHEPNMTEMKHELIQGVELKDAEKSLGFFGLVHNLICKDFDIKQQVFYAELDWHNLYSFAQNASVQFKEIPKYPEVRRDLALILEKQTSFASVKNIAKKEGKQLLKDITLFDIYEGEKLSGKKSYAIALTFRDDTKTLTDSDIDQVMNRLIKKYETELNAEIRK